MSATWRTSDRESEGWHGQWRWGRCQFGYHVYRHRGTLPDRWVFQPFLIYDRAVAGGRTPEDSTDGR